MLINNNVLLKYFNDTKAEDNYVALWTHISRETVYSVNLSTYDIIKRETSLRTLHSLRVLVQDQADQSIKKLAFK
jgi:hypothetical protein